MQRAFNVRLILFSSVVFSAHSLLNSEKQDVRRQEHTSSLYRASTSAAEELASLLREDLAKEQTSSLRRASTSATEELASLLRADLAKERVVSEQGRRVELLASLLQADLAKAAASAHAERAQGRRVALRVQKVKQSPNATGEHAELLLPMAVTRPRSSTSLVKMTATQTTGWQAALKALVSEHPGLQMLVSPIRKMFFSVFIWALLTLLLGMFYHHEKPHPPKLDPEGVNVSLHDRERLDRHRWRFGLFEHAEEPRLCCFSFFCAPIRWADTMRMAGFMNYYSALMLAVGLTVLGYLTLGVGFLLLLGVCVNFRERMKQKFDIRSQASSTSWDWLTFAFCPWCTITQEARQIEEAYLARHPSVRHEYHSAVVRLPARKI